MWASSLDRFRELDRVDCYLRSLQGDLWKQQAGQASGLRWLRGKVLQILTLQSANDLDCMDTVSRDIEHTIRGKTFISVQKRKKAIDYPVCKPQEGVRCNHNNNLELELPVFGWVHETVLPLCP